MNAYSPRVVLDTNIVVSAALIRGGLEFRILRHVLKNELRLCLSAAILNEYAEVLARPKFGFSKGVRQKLLADLKHAAIFIAPNRHLHISPDPDDNMFLECAEAARADYFVTGNTKHFPSEWKRTRVISSRQLLVSM